MGRSGKVLVVGGGIGGMSAAISLRKAGFDVDLIDIDPHWRVYGTGISITSPTLRAFRELGVLDEVVAQGSVNHSDFRYCAPSGEIITEVKNAPLSPDLPIGGGIMRPVLHNILSARVRACGTRVRLGLTVAQLTDTGARVDAAFTDGSSGSYDLVIGADGVNSKLREMLFPGAPKPKFTGQGSWRVTAPRPADYVASVYFGGAIKAGINAVSRDQMYMFCLEPRQEDFWATPETQWKVLKESLSIFGGYIGAIRDSLGPSTYIIYRPLTALIMPAPWYKGRVLLIGDAVHATPPHLASGAGTAVEDGIVIGELLQKHDIPEAFKLFMERRFERCRLVVEHSVRIGDIELHDGPVEEQRRLWAEATATLNLPI